MPPPDVVEHVHPLPVCGFGAHNPNAPQCAGLGPLVACGQIIDPLHPGFGQALCWHRRVLPPPPPPVPPPVPPVPPPDGVTTTGPVTTPGTQPPTQPTDQPPTQPPPETPAGGSSTTPGSGTGTQPGTPTGPPPDGPITDPPPPTGWDWWWRYWWLFPALIALLIALGLLYKLLEWLGILKLLKDLLAALWEAIRQFLNGGLPPTPPETPEPPTEETPEEEDDPRDEDVECEGVCELVGTPRITLHPEGWVIVVPDCPPGAIWLAHPFNMNAQFIGTCCCCEYRQEIKGYAYVRPRGTTTWLDLGMVIGGGAQLHPDIYQEDGKPYFYYGHRKGQRNIPEDEYLMTRRSGCVYKGSDMPGIRGLNLGDHVVINLWFRGTVIDVCTGAIKWQDEWQLKTRGHIGLEMSFPYLDSKYIYEKLY